MKNIDVNSPLFWGHRYDETLDCFRFLELPRSVHASSTFLTDEYLPDTSSFTAMDRSEVAKQRLGKAPIHFIFHSGYCCSTMLARAFDLEGASMGLKEPVLLNDMIGMLRRGIDPQVVVEILEQCLRLLERPFSEGESIIVKPSNIVNRLSFTMLSMRPQAKALLLYAPLEDYLASIARKGIWGRLWVRELLVGLLKDNLVRGNFSMEQLLSLTDLQIAAVGWLSEQALFYELHKRYGPDRVRILDSRTFLEKPPIVLAKLLEFFEMSQDKQVIDGVLSGPAFNTNSKTMKSFDQKNRSTDQNEAKMKFSEEIEIVSKWVVELAKADNIVMEISDMNFWN